MKPAVWGFNQNLQIGITEEKMEKKVEKKEEKKKKEVEKVDKR
jgi:hypothetical protein